MTDTDRIYAQGSLGEQPKPEVKKQSLWTRAKYRFENSVASGNSFGLMLAVASLVLAVVMTFIKSTVAEVEVLNIDVTEDPTYFEQYWGSLSTILKIDAHTTWAERIISLLNWAIAIAISGTVIGFITAMITASIAKLRAGGSTVIETGHTLILGWSPRIYPIIKELAIAKSSERNPAIVIFSELPREKVLTELGRRVGKLGKVKVVVRTGKPTIPADLMRSNLSAASSIIVLDDNDNADATTISIVLAIKAAVGDNHAPIVAEIDDPYIAETLQMSSRIPINAVRSQEVIARMTAQASRQPGLAAVVLDLIDFDGNEIYFAKVSELVGKTYAEALAAFATSSTIGLYDPVHGLHLNPPASTKIADNASIVVVAEDDSTAVYSPVQLSAGSFKAPIKKAVTPAEHLLVIGWSSMGRAVMENMAGFLPRGSSVHIVARSQFVNPADLDGLYLGHVKVTHTATSGHMTDLVAAAEARHYDAVIVLGYREAIDATEADAQTMLTMLQMNALFADPSNKVQTTRLVAEILDSTMVELAQVAAVDDLVVSDVLAALVIAQISENDKLAEVLNDLFDADGAQIEMEPIERYAAVGEQVSFGTLVARVQARNGSAFGYRSAADAHRDASKGVTLNPAKSAVFTVAAGDSVVVIRD
jgi:hypothetical protein